MTIKLIISAGLISLFVISINGEIESGNGVCESLSCCVKVRKDNSYNNRIDIKFMMEHVFRQPGVLVIFPEIEAGILHIFSNITSNEIYRQSFRSSGNFSLCFTRQQNQEAERLLKQPINNTFTYQFIYKIVDKQTEEKENFEKLMQQRKSEEQEMENNEKKRLRELSDMIKKLQEQEENDLKLQAKTNELSNESQNETKELGSENKMEIVEKRNLSETGEPPKTSEAKERTTELDEKEENYLKLRAKTDVLSRESQNGTEELGSQNKMERVEKQNVSETGEPPKTSEAKERTTELDEEERILLNKMEKELEEIKKSHAEFDLKRKQEKKIVDKVESEPFAVKSENLTIHEGNETFIEFLRDTWGEAFKRYG